jgi:hypothetical protein
MSILYVPSSINGAFINISVSDNNILMAGVNNFNINNLVGLINEDYKFISYL